MLYAGHTCHVHTLLQSVPRLTNVPRILRSLLVSHCKCCPEYVMDDSLLQHSCVHAHLKYDVAMYIVVLLFFCPFVSVLVVHGITQHEYFQGVILLPLIRDCFPIYIGYLGSTVSRTYWYCTI